MVRVCKRMVIAIRGGRRGAVLVERIVESRGVGVGWLEDLDRADVMLCNRVLFGGARGD